MILRAADPCDAGALGAILAGFARETAWLPELWSGAETIGFCDRMIARGWVRVAEAGKVLGFLARDEEEVVALYVARQARGRGVGARLLAEAQSSARRLELWTFAANVPARRFYLRHGFSETGRSDGTRNDEGLPDIRLTWERGAA